MVTDREIFGLTLAAARVGAGLSQRELAAKMDSQASHVCQWELGKKMPAVLNVSRFAQAVGLQTHELYQLHELLVRAHARRTGKPLDPAALTALGSRGALTTVFPAGGRERATQLLAEALAILSTLPGRDERSEGS